MTTQKKLEKLMKLYECNDVEQLYNYWYETYVNGTLSQCRDIIAALPPANQRELLQYLRKSASAESAADYCALKISLLK